MKLYDYQIEAIHNMKNGCILCGGVGSGKSLTSIGYYYLQCGGKESFLKGGKMIDMTKPKDLYIITTARKRDTLEWDKELTNFLLNKHSKLNYYKDQTVVIDSWNNISKYTDVEKSFFIFDEQRVVGTGAWVKAFYKITEKNNWILLSATPGDTWLDYAPVFIANGFYRNITEFKREHVVYRYIGNFPKLDRYLNTTRLMRLRNSILVNMDFRRDTISKHEYINVNYDSFLYKKVSKYRTNPFEYGFIPCKEKDDPDCMTVGTDIDLKDVTPIMKGWSYIPQIGDKVKVVEKPIENISELCYIWRKITNIADGRQLAVLDIYEKHPKVIIFYSFDYELEILKNLPYGLHVEVAEWNGHKHQDIPTGDKWVYLVQYTSGCEGWNCIKTDTMIFYSQHYSYKVMEQAAGRIDRLNTPYKNLYYYHLKSLSPIDVAISRALKNKKKFNESRFIAKRSG